MVKSDNLYPKSKALVTDAYYLPKGHYFLSHAVGCLIKEAEKTAQNQYFEEWKERGAHAWDAWLSVNEQFCSELALLLGTNAQNICPQSNVSSALSKILYSIPKETKRNTILLSERDFPSTAYVLQQLEREGYQLRYLPKDAAIEDVSVWEEALTEDVQWAFITHVTSNQSIRVPVKEITALSSSKNIYSIVDIAQSVGVIPISLNEWQADFVVGSCVKWLCGGPGAGFLWVSPNRIHDCAPRDLGWFSHEEPFEGDLHRFRYAKNAKKFWGGTPSILPFSLAAESIKHQRNLGIQTIHQHNQKIIHFLYEALTEAGYHIASPQKHKERGGTLVINISNPILLKDLEKKDIHCDLREGQLLRLSPHIYTDMNDALLVKDFLINYPY